MKHRSNNFKDLVNLLAYLRSPNGCPWDKKQTHTSILPNLIEETYEVVEAIRKKDNTKLKEELGDLLLQVLFHAQMEAEWLHHGQLNVDQKKKFDIYDVIENLILKLKTRHPHVFKKKVNLTSKQVLQNWEKIKLSQKKESHSALSGLPKHLPALVKAYRMQEKISRLGFEWSKKEEILSKIEEEFKELKRSLRNKNSKKTEEELGDLFLILVTLSRKLKKDPELVLRKAIDKFVLRFSRMEKEVLKKGKKISDLNLTELERLWQKIKV
ncbi:MAG: nucleoside triphosphate pyrophosphohydrolase [candidate division Zixibacteria bacterium RBG_16_40_9]|nr:MAG: nucleoside triphosphate pyrophosphohydrolase [candidate division Zixibacteria bacterium RBG_16_40_9]